MVLKNLVLTVSTLAGCGGDERAYFETVSTLGGLVVKKELIFNSFYFGRLWWL